MGEIDSAEHMPGCFIAECGNETTVKLPSCDPALYKFRVYYNINKAKDWKLANARTGYAGGYLGNKTEVVVRRNGDHCDCVMENDPCFNRSAPFGCFNASMQEPGRRNVSTCPPCDLLDGGMPGLQQKVWPVCEKPSCADKCALHTMDWGKKCQWGVCSDYTLLQILYHSPLWRTVIKRGRKRFIL